MNILAYVHLRNIHGSTGHGRVARQMIEHLAKVSDDRLHILADPEDHRKIVHKVGAPWTSFSYDFFDHETSRQQARWVVTRKPVAEDYWQDTQIVYCTSASYVPTRKARLVVTLHDAATFEPGALPGNWRYMKHRFKSKVLYQMLFRKADLIQTGSHFSAQRIAHYFPTARSRLRVVPYAVTPRFFSPVSAEGESFLEALGLNNRPFILLPGGLNHRKNAELVLKAWPSLHELHPDLVLVVSGHCEPSYVAPANALGNSIKLTGFVSDEALCSLYHSAQIVWFPSLYEGFGIPIIEAMACGTPIVTSETTSLPEVAGDAAILVRPSSTPEHVEAIDSLLRDWRQRHSLAERGRARAQQFTWPRTVDKLRQHFLSLV